MSIDYLWCEYFKRVLVYEMDALTPEFWEALRALCH
jgi:hypothetical protein